MLKPLSEEEKLVLVAPRELIVLAGENQNWDEVTIVKRGERRAISLDIRVQARARGQMIRIFEVAAGAHLNILHTVSLEAEARWQNVICIRGRGEVRIRRSVTILGAGAETHLACLGVMEQAARISVADEIYSHAPKTVHRLQTKLVLCDSARAEVRGRVVVTAQATQSITRERLDHLLLGEQATAVVIPELEVDTDEVVCSHGATISRPSVDELFYLASRGLSIPAAERLLAQGFIAEALTDLPDQAAHESLKMLCSY